MHLSWKVELLITKARISASNFLLAQVINIEFVKTPTSFLID